MKPNPYEINSLASQKYHACKLAFNELEKLKNSLASFYRKDEALMVHELQKQISSRAEQITING